MKIGTVIGSVWATRKAGCLQGQTFLVVDSPAVWKVRETGVPIVVPFFAVSWPLIVRVSVSPAGHSEAGRTMMVRRTSRST